MGLSTRHSFTCTMHCVLPTHYAWSSHASYASIYTQDVTLARSYVVILALLKHCFSTSVQRLGSRVACDHFRPPSWASGSFAKLLHAAQVHCVIQSWNVCAFRLCVRRPCPYKLHSYLNMQNMPRVGQNYKIQLGLARTVWIHRIWPYIWWFPCQIYRIYTAYIWFWPTLNTVYVRCVWLGNHQMYQRGSMEQMSWNVTFLMQTMFD